MIGICTKSGIGFNSFENDSLGAPLVSVSGQELQLEYCYSRLVEIHRQPSFFFKDKTATSTATPVFLAIAMSIIHNKRNTELIKRIVGEKNRFSPSTAVRKK